MIRLTGLQDEPVYINPAQVTSLIPYADYSQINLSDGRSHKVNTGPDATAALLRGVEPDAVVEPPAAPRTRRKKAS